MADVLAKNSSSNGMHGEICYSNGIYGIIYSILKAMYVVLPYILLPWLFAVWVLGSYFQRLGEKGSTSGKSEPWTLNPIILGDVVGVVLSSTSSDKPSGAKGCRVPSLIY